MKQKLLEALRKSNSRKLQGFWVTAKKAQIEAKQQRQAR